MMKRFFKLMPGSMLLLFFSMICLSFAQKPHVASKALEMDNLVKEAQLKTVTGKVGKTSHIERYVYNENFGPLSGTYEQMAMNYLNSNATRFGLKNAGAELKAVQVNESPGGYHVRLRQYVDKYPVFDSDITVSINRENKVVFVANDYRPNLTLESASVSLSQLSAISAAKDYLHVTGKMIIDPSAELMVFQSKTEGALLAYRTIIVTDEPMGDWEVFVAADDGHIMNVRDITRYYKKTDGSGLAFDPDPLTKAGVAYGAPYVDNNDADVPELNAERDTVALRDLDYNGSVYSLSGPYCVLTDMEGPTDVFPTLSDPNGFNYTRSQQEFEDVMVYYHVDKSYRWLDSLGFSVPGLLQFHSDPHGLNGDDNSHYVPSGNYCAWGEGGVDDAEDADVIWHEYAHAIQDNITGGMSYTGETMSLQEGSSDYWAASYSRSLYEFGWGEVFNWDGHNPFWPGRLCNLNWHYPENYVSGHDGGQLWSSALMKIWEDLGREVTDKDFIEAHYLWGTSPGMQDAAAAFVQADRMLYNGSHLSSIIYWLDNRGLVDAANYIPQISHDPLHDTEDVTGPYNVTSVIVPGTAPLDPNQLFVIYEYASKKNGKTFADSVALLPTGNVNEYSAQIPGPGYATDVHYYLSIVDSAANYVVDPMGAPTNFYSFAVGPDTVAPVIVHNPLRDQAYIRWPAAVRAKVTDNIGIDNVVVNYYINTVSNSGSFTLTDDGSGNFSGVFDVDTTAISVGDSIFYRITATDVSSNGNIANDPVSGFHSFKIIDTKGLVLIVNDDPVAANISDDKGGYPRSKGTFGASANSMQRWLIDLGYVADVVDVATALTTNWNDYSIVINSSGANTGPVADQAYRTKWEDYVADPSHKYLIEGGEVGYDAVSTPGYPSFAGPVLHASAWNSDNAGGLNLRSQYSNHQIATSPNTIPSTIAINYVGYGDEDAMQNASEAYVVFETASNPGNAGVLVYDDNPNPLSAQMTYFAFNLSAIDTVVAKNLLENTLEFLLAPENAPIGSIAGNVDLTDTANDSGVTVMLSGLRKDTTVTDMNGDYTFSGLYNGTYSVTVHKDGYFPAYSTINDIVVNGNAVTGIDFSLDPIQNATISGVVTLSDTTDYSGVLVQVLNQPGRSDTTDAAGNYTITDVLPGAVTVKAFKTGYSSMKVDTTIANNGATYTINFDLVPGANEIYFDFEADNGNFTGTSSWEWGAPTSGPGSAYQGVNVWATNLSGDYSINDHSELTSPVLDLGAFANPMLRFAQWYDMEESTTAGRAWDGGNLKISTDGGATFQIVTPVGGYPDSVYASTTSNALAGQWVYSGTSGGWVEAEFDLGAYSGDQVILKFDFGSDGSVTKPGWYIDSLYISDETTTPNSPANLTVLDNQGRVLLGWDSVIENMLKADKPYSKSVKLLQYLETLQKEAGLSNFEPVSDEIAKLVTYNIYASENGGAFGLKGTSTSTSYADSVVTIGSTYSYYVTAAIGNLESDPSDTVSTTVQASTTIELAYDDGTPGGGYYWPDAGTGSGNRMTPPGLVTILSAKFYLRTPNAGVNNFTAKIFDVSGGQVGAELGSVPVTNAANDSWVEVDFSSLNITTDHDFLVFMEYDGTNQPVFGYDTDNNGRAWDYDPTAGGWAAWNETYFMRAMVSTATGIATELGGGIPTTYALQQNYPNPFNPETMIKYQIPQASHVRLEIYNLLGQKVRTLVNDYQNASYYTVRWDGLSSTGNKVASGVYIYRITAGTFTATHKMLLLK